MLHVTYRKVWTQLKLPWGPAYTTESSGVTCIMFKKPTFLKIHIVFLSNMTEKTENNPYLLLSNKYSRYKNIYFNMPIEKMSYFCSNDVGKSHLLKIEEDILNYFEYFLSMY